MSPDKQRKSGKEEKVKIELEVPKSQLKSDSFENSDAASPATAPAVSQKDEPPEDKLHDQGKMTVAGYTLGEVVGSVSKVPHPENDPRPVEEKPSKTKPSVVSNALFVVGIGLIVLGVLFMLVNIGITIILCLLGAAAAGAGLMILRGAHQNV